MRESQKSPAPVRSRSTDSRLTIEREFRVVTPVHGGGVGWDSTEGKSHVRPIDPVTPVRSAAIRGQLRFWWRATTGCTFASLAEMRVREAEIWGSSAGRDLSGPGATSIRVKLQPKPEETTALAGVSYGAFALMNGFTNDRVPKGILTHLKGPVQLEVTSSAELSAEVELAMDAWLAFGGIGGRTRRGFGAVDAQSVSLKDRLAGREAKQRLVPSLVGARIHWAGAALDASRAHADALDALKTFRQGENVGRNRRQPGEKSPGRSRWPEADQIRRLRANNDPRHKPVHQVQRFPRAAFGMPIIFHFKDRLDPRDNSLQPQASERMASPLILRPIRRDGEWHAGAIVLNVPGLHDEIATVSLKQERTETDVKTSLGVDELEKIEPLKELEGDTVLERFLSFFARR